MNFTTSNLKDQSLLFCFLAGFVLLFFGRADASGSRETFDMFLSTSGVAMFLLGFVYHHYRIMTGEPSNSHERQILVGFITNIAEDQKRREHHEP